MNLFVRLAGACAGAATFFVVTVIASTNFDVAVGAAGIGAILGFIFARRSPDTTAVFPDPDAALLGALARLTRVEHELTQTRARLSALERQVERATSTAAVGEAASAAIAAPAPLSLDATAPPLRTTTAPSLPAVAEVAFVPPPTTVRTLSPATVLPATGSPATVSPATVPVSSGPQSSASDALPVTAPPPAISPPPIASAGGSLWRFFAGDNAAVRVGVAVLLIGVAFLLQYAAESGVFPPVVRLWSAVAVGGALLGVGLKLRVTRRRYGLALAGGGFAALFLCIFAAQSVLDLAAPQTARALYVILSTGFLVIALVCREESLAVFATIGALVSPVMVRSGGALDGLLLYDLVMAVITAVLAVKFNFRLVARLAALVTFGILGAAVVGSTVVTSIIACGATLAAVVAAFGSIPVLRALAGHDKATPTLVFGVPIAAFGVFAVIVAGHTATLAATALGVAAVALSLSAALWRRATTLSRAHLILGVGFLTYAAPLYVSAAPSAAFWALEGVGLVYLGTRQKDAVSWTLGLLLPLAGIWLATTGPSIRPEGAWPVINGAFLGLAVPALGLLFGGTLTYRHATTPLVRQIAGPLAILALLALGAAALSETSAVCTPGTAMAFAALATALVGLLGERVGAAADFPEQRWAVALVPVAGAVGAYAVFTNAVLSTGASPLVWLATAGVAYVLMRHQRFGLLTTIGHMSTALVVGTALSLALRSMLAGSPHLAWLAPLPWAALLAMLARPGLAARLLCPAAPEDSAASRLDDLRRTYAVDVVGSVAIATTILLLREAVGVGSVSGLPYVPLVGPIDLVWLAGSVVLGLSLRGTRDHLAAESRTALGFALGVLVLAFVGTALARGVHHYGDVAWGTSAMFDSTVFQSSLSITYGLTGLALMMLATRRVERALYLFGAALLGFVVVKLVFIDLVHTGTLARIVAFMGVGLILLVVGYLVPLPPKAPSEDTVPPGP